MIGKVFKDVGVLFQVFQQDSTYPSLWHACFINREGKVENLKFHTIVGKQFILDNEVKKIFTLSPANDSYGARIFIPADVELSGSLKDVLRNQSVWKGDSSNHPDRYSMWEFPLKRSESWRLDTALTFLRHKGFHQVRSLPEQ